MGDIMLLKVNPNPTASHSNRAYLNQVKFSSHTISDFEDKTLDLQQINHR
jgi:hypothetical protein